MENIIENEKYVTPEMEISFFDTADVITVSDPVSEGHWDPDNTGEWIP